MGVPKFYRWISERYPCLSEVVVEFNIPEFDNLYLDMNGIVHVCSHPEDDNPHFRITEEKIFSDIFHYIEFLFRMIKPKKVFFMAIDGVAPRAKMNQQRGRRFRSAYEAEELVKQAEAKGEKLPEEQRFDSNCITPGTSFMARLQEQLKYFVVHKVSSDPLWQGPRIFLSGHQAPGEGEHKIMDFIRYEKSQAGYDANTRHCLYGLDADLMMLGLTSHEPHFSLLREEVRFGSKKERNKRAPTAEETTFHLLHLSLMREYLEFEFTELKTSLPFPYSLESIIDDWILMGVLVGNDFIPHLPNLHINHNALPMLWQNYIEVLPTLDGYLNEGGHLNLRRFEVYLEKLSTFDTEKFEENYVDMKWLESKVGGKPINTGCTRDIRIEVKRRKKKVAAETHNAFSVLSNLHSGENSTTLVNPVSSNSLDEPNEEILDPEMLDSDTFDAEFRQYKRNYYMDKMKYEVVSPEILKEQAEGYIRAIQWILLYYFEGCPSWSWYYPHHYAPFMSDVKDFSQMKIKFELGKPFLPFQQLMAVLPAASKELLPEPFWHLMTSDNSPVIEYYPLRFESDLNGKQQEWEAVVLIPFIQEDRLLAAMEPIYARLPEEAANRNTHGPCYMSHYVPEELEVYRSAIPDKFPDILSNHAKLTVIPNDQYHMSGDEIRKGLMDGVRLDVFFPGFPTLKHIPHTVKLKKACVKVFQQASRGENMIVSITQSGSDLDPDVDFEELATEYLGTTVYVGWPHLFEAKVVGIADEEFRFDFVESDKGKKARDAVKTSKKLTQHTKEDAEIWRRKASSIQERYLERRGVDVGHTSLLLQCCPMTGRKYTCGSHGKITLEKQFGSVSVSYAKQASVKNIAVHDSSFCQYKTLEELFEEKAAVFMLGSPQYGCQGEVIEVQQEAGRVRVRFTTVEEPNIHNIMYKQQSLSTRYMPSYIVAQKLGISSHFVARLTGNIFILRGAKENPKNNNKVNVGLNLKFSKRGEEVPGYVKRVDGQWIYSEQTVQTLQEYFEKYYEMLDCISSSPSSGQDLFYEQDLFQSDSEVKLNDILSYLKELPCMKITPIKCDADILDESVVEAIEEEVNRLTRFDKPAKSVVMQVKPHLLFKPMLDQGFLIPDPTVEYFLFDRVICVRMGFAVPFGLRGTVVGIHPPEEGDDTIYEVVFDVEFVGGITVRCSANRGYRVRSATLINLSHGERKTISTGPNIPQGFKLSASNSAQDSGSRVRSDRKLNNWPQDSGSRVRSDRQSYSQMKGERPGSSNYNSRDQQQWRQPDNQGHYNGKQGYQDTDHQRGYRRHNDRNVDHLAFNSNAPFVAPKVAASPTSASANRGLQNRVLADNSTRFADMWKQLQESADVLPIPATQAPPGGTSDSYNQGTSLQQAAKALDKISLPSATNVDTSAGSASFSEDSARNNDVNVLLGADGQVKGGQVKGGQVCVKSSESVDIGQAISDSFHGLSVNNELSDANNSCQDGSTALKQMLKINSDQSSAPEGSTKKAAVNYGKQVSVQELFEGAKLSSSKSETTASESSTTQRQQTPKSQQQQQQRLPAQQQQRTQQQQQRPQQHNKQQSWNPQMNEHQPRWQQQRNPVMELSERCKAMHLLTPQYDYNMQHGKVISRVVLGNGVRFEGSLCATREEAAESVASIAMLNLPDFNNYPPYPQFSNFPQTDAMFSPQSAFSPVGRPAFSPRMGGAYSQLRQFHNRLPAPGFFPRGSAYQQRGGQRGFPQGHPGQQQPAYHNPDMQADVTSQHTEEVKKNMSVTDPAFIPLQVARKQKTPQKRKDAVYPEHTTAVHADTAHVDAVAHSNMSDNGTSVSAYQNLRNEHSKSKTDGNASKQKSAPRRRRPRIAANLNFDQ